MEDNRYSIEQRNALSRILREAFLEAKQERLVESEKCRKKIEHRAHGIVKALYDLGCKRSYVECLEEFKKW